MREIKISKKEDNKKIVNVILKEFPNLSLNTLNKALRKKDIRINNIRISQNELVHENDVIQIYITDNLLLENSAFNIKDCIVYEDGNILVINKPEKILVNSNTDTESTLETLLNKYADGKFTARPTHRIDRNTKGLVIFSKNEESLNELLYCFKNHLIEKYYLALVYGVPKQKTAVLNAFLFKDAKTNNVIISNTKKTGYTPIQTQYTVIDQRKDKSCLLEVQLLTGKTHQIRAHLAYENLPIIGDGKYGQGTINKQFKKDTQQLVAYKVIFHTNALKKLAYLDGKIIKISQNISKYLKK